MEFSQGRCAICDKHDVLTPLHGDDGGPGCCLLCRGKWHAEHGRRRKLGRIAIRAMKAFIDGGGRYEDFDKLKTAAISSDWLDLDPLGYLAGEGEPRHTRRVRSHPARRAQGGPCESVPCPLAP
jgi:hypothetical protein